MSLRAFHILFIIASIALAVGFGSWCVSRHLAGGGIFSFVAAGGLLVYGIWFFRKIRKAGPS